MSIQDNLSPNIKIIAVSKTFELSKIKPLIDHGHDHFGENKLQEAQFKWSETIKINKSIKLHMIGKLQSNKAKKAVELFHYIHSLDNQKLSDALSKAEKEKNKKLNYFIQVNIGNEPQKSGVLMSQAEQFISECKSKYSLNIVVSKDYFPISGLKSKNIKIKFLSSNVTNSEFYSSLIFSIDIQSKKNYKNFISGGRYDELTNNLGLKKISAVGAAVNMSL